MAKINLTTQHNQENFSLLAPLGVLICMVVTVMGIKLWWFKHRLTFEQSSTQNGASGGTTPAVIVPRRGKQQKYKRDKRYSQQIYDSVEVHGVFRQKLEDDVEIQRPQRLPPVRIRQLSESATSLILPPPRTKRRDQVHSTAFEDLEIVTPPLTTASSSDLTAIPEINTKISLTFEEFERQFKLKEIKSEDAKPPTSNNEVTEIPIPPLRLNRSSSAITKPEKTQKFLKSSQSITIPEHHKIIEKKPGAFSSPKEDLTKIDDYDEPKIFETFGERRPTGYIKYEEVDGDLQEQYESELNAEIDKDYYPCQNTGITKSPGIEPALKALRNERIIYNNDLNESPDIQVDEEYNFEKSCYKWKDLAYKEDDFVDTKSSIKFDENKFETFADNETDTEIYSYSVKERRPSECIQSDRHNKRELITTECFSTEENRNTEFVKEPQSFEKVFVTEFQVPPEFVKNSPEIVTELKTVNEYIQNVQVKEENPNEQPENFDSISFQEDFDNQFTSWPQFEEKIQTPKVNFRKFKNQDLEKQCSFEENDDFGATNSNENSTSCFSETENQTETKQRSPTGIVGDWIEPPVVQDMEEWKKDFNNKFYNQIRSFMTREEHEVTFDFSGAQNSDNEKEHNNNSAIKERRPTGYVRQDEYYVTFGDESSDEDCKANVRAKGENLANKVHSTVEIVEIPEHKVNFADTNISKDEIEKFTLNQRRPTGFVKPVNTEETCDDIDYQDASIDLEFVETSNFKDGQDISSSDIKQRRPTGYIKQSEISDVTIEESTPDKQKQPVNAGYIEIPKSYLELHHDSPTVKFKESDETFKELENKAESLLKQRRPTGYMQKEELNKLEKQVNFQIDNENMENDKKNNEALSQRRPTGFIRKEETEKHVNFILNINSQEDGVTEFGNEQLKQRRPTGYVRKKELKCLDQPAPIFHASNADDSNTDFDNHLWQEMEKDIELDGGNNFEEEFAKIRHSYEMNEADFLEPKDELQKSPEPLGFGKSIEDDWENFKTLKTQTIIKPLQSPEDIKITFSDAELNGTTSILKEYKVEEDIQAKPRKSKVTFDFKTDERVIPARKNHNCSEEDSDFDDDIYDKPPPPIPPQPKQRVSNRNFNTETTLSPIIPIPMEISLFGSQISRQDNGMEDSWSAIRKHRSMTEEFQNNYIHNKLSPPQPSCNTPPPKPEYRNPMAQLAIQRAKEARADMDGFKSRSINNRKTDTTTKNQKQKFLNLNSDSCESTEA